MDRTNIINAIVEKIGAVDYLEIGVESGTSFKSCIAKNKTGVDPSPRSASTHKKYSSDFFRTLPIGVMYDVIFIDGSHDSKDVLEDIKSSLNHLRVNGVIVMHDCNPAEELHQRVPAESITWNGDVWKAWVHYRSTRKDLEMICWNTDHGTSTIRKGTQKLLKLPKVIDYNGLEKNRLKWLNLRSPESFHDWVSELPST